MTQAWLGCGTRRSSDKATLQTVAKSENSTFRCSGLAILAAWLYRRRAWNVGGAPLGEQRTLLSAFPQTTLASYMTHWPEKPVVLVVESAVVISGKEKSCHIAIHKHKPQAKHFRPITSDIPKDYSTPPPASDEQTPRPSASTTATRPSLLPAPYS